MDIEHLLQELTVEEKVLLTAGDGWWHTTPIDRLSIPPIRLSDGPNGVRGTHFFDSTPSACLPCGTALGATFDTELIRRVGRLLSDEAHAKGAHVLLGPTVNIQRGPLGGRGFESFSEDPLLSGVLAGHYVLGVQEKGVSATLKHFTCNDMESQRMAVNVMVTDRALREIYLLPFMIAIEMAQPRLVMTAYSKINGCHVAESRQMLQDILRDEWKWDGLVVSDWFGTYSTSSAIKAGLDLEMPGPTRWRGEALAHAVASNKVKRSELDARARNVLRLIKHATENTSIPPRAPETQLNTPEHITLLREAAAKSIVLLKNERNILPFDPKKRVAVIGPNANIATYCGGGSACLTAYSTVTPLEGIKSVASDVVFAQGCYGHQSLPQLGKLLRTADGQRQGFALRVYNDPPPAAGAKDTRRLLEERVLNDANIWFVDYENPELAPVWYAEAEGILVLEKSEEWEFGLSVHGTGQLFIDGELVVSNMADQRLGSSFLGSGTVEEVGSKRIEAGRSYRILVQWGCSKTTKLKAEGVIDFGLGGLRFSGCPKLDPARAVQEAVEIAGSVDQVVLCIGTSGEWESEGQDRTSMALPPGTDDLVAAVSAANPNTAVIVQSGTPVAMPWVDQAGALLQAWFGGNQCGNGIADVLFGVVNPAAKLPLTMPRRLADNPSALNFRSDNGRVLYSEDVYVGYRWYDALDVAPLFPFGHGLSYTHFELSGLTVTPKTESVADSSVNGHTNGMTNGYSHAPKLLDPRIHNSLLVRVNVRNIGSRPGAEVVQVYIAPPAPTPLLAAAGDTITRPAKELKGFAKLHLDAGSADEAAITLDVLRATSYWSELEDCWRSDAGEYTLLVGTSSRCQFLRQTVVIEKSTTWKGLRA
ncbi:glycoside hydrolase [Thozetella sp. PMI_491]|nr:glycoside hydrolase [Thozetella sp. PMI_491]